jgi:hypothetical protein
LTSSARKPSLTAWPAGLLIHVLYFFILSSASAPAYGATVIERENARPGDSGWVLTDPADHEIEGYASATSLNRGATIRFFISTKDPTYTMDIYRMGWYGGVGARLVKGGIQREGLRQTMPVPDPTTGLIECDWMPSYDLITATPDDHTDWVSGVYLVKLSGMPSGKQSYIIFVLRDDERPSDFLFQSSVTTYQAYNSWGGKSTYPSSSINEEWAYKVSFNRPYARSAHPLAASGVGAGDFLTATSIHPTSPISPAGWEYNMVRWLEREGYDVTYTTNIDTHLDSTWWKRHKVWLSVGHDEYWSREMRSHVEEARERGVGLGFFSSNSCYWQIRLEPSPLTGQPHRTMVAYKEAARTHDPYALDNDPANDRLVTGQWRDPPVNDPEESLIGVMYDTVPVDGDIIISQPSHAVFSGVALPQGAKLQGLLGYEVDRRFGDSLKDLTILARSPYVVGERQGHAAMTIYTWPSNAVVFATGSMQWSWGLDEYNVPAIRSSRLSEAAQQITRNILSWLLQGGRAVSEAGDAGPQDQYQPDPAASATPQ